VFFFSGSGSERIFYRLFTYVLPLEIQLSRGEGWDPIHRLNPATFLCLDSVPEMRASPNFFFWASKKLVTGPNGIMVAQTFCDIFF
jgi:hypothetical protein